MGTAGMPPSCKLSCGTSCCSGLELRGGDNEAPRMTRVVVPLPGMGRQPTDSL